MKSTTQLNSISRRSGSIAACAVALTLGALVFSGCNSPAKQILGHWTIDTTQGSMAAQLKNNPMAESFTKMYAFDFTNDGKFKMSSFMSGTYKITDHDVLLHADTIMGISAGTTSTQNDEHATLSGDGKTLTINDKGQTLVLIKSADK